MFPDARRQPRRPPGTTLACSRDRYLQIGGRRRGLAVAALAASLASVLLILAAGGRPWQELQQGEAAGRRSAPASAPALVLPRRAALPWLDQGYSGRKPLYVAATSFFVLTCWNVAAQLLVCRSRGTGLVVIEDWGQQVRLGFAAHLLVSTLGLCSYVNMSLGSFVLVLGIGKSEHLILRSFVWTVSNPLQWYVFMCSFTAAGGLHMASVLTSTTMMHIFGVLLLSAEGPTVRWLCFWASCAFFVVMFQQAFRLPPLRESRRASDRFLYMWLGLWSMYPLVQFAQLTDMISIWSAQVLLFSVLDVVTKCVSFFSVVASRALLSLDTLEQTSKLVRVAYDVILIVDEDFVPVEVAQTTPQLASCWRKAKDRAPGEQPETMLSRLTPQDAHVLRQAAKLVDESASTGGGPAKCVLGVRLDGEAGEVQAQWLVSKATHGRRMIAVQVISMSGVGGAAF